MRTKPLLLSFLLLAVGCEGTQTIEEADPGTAEIVPSYERDVAPILERGCAGCHSSKGLIAGGVELDSYLGAYGTRVKSVCTAIEPELVQRYAQHLVPFLGNTPEACGNWTVASMPPAAKSRLTAAEQLLLVKWVVAGGPR